MGGFLNFFERFLKYDPFLKPNQIIFEFLKQFNQNLELSFNV